MPLLIDGTFKLTESRAISTYLADKFDLEAAKSGHGNGRGSELYPSTLQDRAQVDEMLFYDVTVITKRFQELMGGEKAFRKSIYLSLLTLFIRSLFASLGPRPPRRAG